MQKTIIALEYYDYQPHVLSITCKILNKDFDLVTAVKAAAKEYCLTKKGRETYSENHRSFNWGDLVNYIPDEICQKHGFSIITCRIENEIRDFNEQLVDEYDIFPEE